MPAGVLPLEEHKVVASAAVAAPSEDLEPSLPRWDRPAAVQWSLPAAERQSVNPQEERCDEAAPPAQSPVRNSQVDENRVAVMFPQDEGGPPAPRSGTVMRPVESPFGKLIVDTHSGPPSPADFDPMAPRCEDAVPSSQLPSVNPLDDTNMAAAAAFQAELEPTAPRCTHLETSALSPPGKMLVNDDTPAVPSSPQALGLVAPRCVRVEPPELSPPGKLHVGSDFPVSPQQTSFGSGVSRFALADPLAVSLFGDDRNSPTAASLSPQGRQIGDVEQGDEPLPVRHIAVGSKTLDKRFELARVRLGADGNDVARRPVLDGANMPAEAAADGLVEHQQTLRLSPQAIAVAAAGTTSCLQDAQGSGELTARVSPRPAAHEETGGVGNALRQFEQPTASRWLSAGEIGRPSSDDWAEKSVLESALVHSVGQSSDDRTEKAVLESALAHSVGPSGKTGGDRVLRPSTACSRRRQHGTVSPLALEVAGRQVDEHHAPEVEVPEASLGDGTTTLKRSHGAFPPEPVFLQGARRPDCADTHQKPLHSAWFPGRRADDEDVVARHHEQEEALQQYLASAGKTNGLFGEQCGIATNVQSPSGVAVQGAPGVPPPPQQPRARRPVVNGPAPPQPAGPRPQGQPGQAGPPRPPRGPGEPPEPVLLGAGSRRVPRTAAQLVASSPALATIAASSAAAVAAAAERAAAATAAGTTGGASGGALARIGGDGTAAAAAAAAAAIVAASAVGEPTCALPPEAASPGTLTVGSRTSPKTRTAAGLQPMGDGECRGSDEHGRGQRRGVNGRLAQPSPSSSIYGESPRPSNDGGSSEDEEKARAASSATKIRKSKHEGKSLSRMKKSTPSLDIPVFEEAKLRSRGRKSTSSSAALPHSEADEEGYAKSTSKHRKERGPSMDIPVYEEGQLKPLRVKKKAALLGGLDNLGGGALSTSALAEATAGSDHQHRGSEEAFKGSSALRRARRNKKPTQSTEAPASEEEKSMKPSRKVSPLTESKAVKGTKSTPALKSVAGGSFGGSGGACGDGGYSRETDGYRQCVSAAHGEFTDSRRRGLSAAKVAQGGTSSLGGKRHSGVVASDSDEPNGDVGRGGRRGASRRRGHGDDDGADGSERIVGEQDVGKDFVYGKVGNETLGLASSGPTIKSTEPAVRDQEGGLAATKAGGSQRLREGSLLGRKVGDGGGDGGYQNAWGIGDNPPAQDDTSLHHGSAWTSSGVVCADRSPPVFDSRRRPKRQDNMFMGTSSSTATPSTGSRHGVPKSIGRHGHCGDEGDETAPICASTPTAADMCATVESEGRGSMVDPPRRLKRKEEEWGGLSAGVTTSTGSTSTPKTTWSAWDTGVLRDPQGDPPTPCREREHKRRIPCESTPSDWSDNGRTPLTCGSASSSRPVTGAPEADGFARTVGSVGSGSGINADAPKNNWLAATPTKARLATAFAAADRPTPPSGDSTPTPEAADVSGPVSVSWQQQHMLEQRDHRLQQQRLQQLALEQQEALHLQEQQKFEKQLQQRLLLEQQLQKQQREKVQTALLGDKLASSKTSTWHKKRLAQAGATLTECRSCPTMELSDAAGGGSGGGGGSSSTAALADGASPVVRVLRRAAGLDEQAAPLIRGSR
eukprot:TRINITY_DN20926_c0_g2_i1.p1 TRINITY_DN20926_c0_g2~~TRINITY_DN20926_c0_g2_i1.p1  ORF type:complete len:1685 (+),score=366.06 TRINITY_DN20926_c0_g2_i1:216-5057(+)